MIMSNEVQKPDKELEWQLSRRKMISQTEEFLSEALRHPELGVVIPTIQVGCGTFSQSLADAFWRNVLSDMET